MAISVDWNTGEIFVPKTYVTLVTGTLYKLDTDEFRRDLKALEDSTAGMPHSDTHTHNRDVTIAGITYAQFIEILPPYTVTFEDGQYAVRLEGSNNNIFDVGILNINQVSVVPTNAAALIIVDVPGAPTECHVSAAYSDSLDILSLSIWLERLGISVIAPTSCKIDWYLPDDTLVFTATDNTADLEGVFKIEQSIILVPNKAYYANVEVTDSEGTIITRRGVPTGP